MVEATRPSTGTGRKKELAQVPLVLNELQQKLIFQQDVNKVLRKQVDGMKENMVLADGNMKAMIEWLKGEILRLETRDAQKKQIV